MQINDDIKKIKTINQIINILSFDSQTIMPESGVEQRKEKFRVI